MLTQSSLVANKLCRLSSFLHNASDEFENVAKYIRDKTIRMSIRSVALQTQQYTQELNSQLSMLKISCVLRYYDEGKSDYVLNKNVPDKKIVERCCSDEVFFSRA